MVSLVVRCSVFCNGPVPAAGCRRGQRSSAIPAGWNSGRRVHPDPAHRINPAADRNLRASAAACAPQPNLIRPGRIRHVGGTNEEHQHCDARVFRGADEGVVAMGVLLSVVLITAILGGFYLLVGLTFPGGVPRGD